MYTYVYEGGEDDRHFTSTCPFPSPLLTRVKRNRYLSDEGRARSKRCGAASLRVLWCGSLWLKGLFFDTHSYMLG